MQIKYLHKNVYKLERYSRTQELLSQQAMARQNQNFYSAKATLAGIELHHMIKKCQSTVRTNLPVWEQFYALAA